MKMKVEIENMIFLKINYYSFQMKSFLIVL
jgi:hypothetical protein